MRMNRKVLVGLLVIGVVLIGGWFALKVYFLKDYPYPIPHEWNSCDTDEDCTVVELRCCSFCECENCIAVNKEGEVGIAEWKKKNCGDCSSVPEACPPPIKSHIPVCLDNICAIKISTY